MNLICLLVHKEQHRKPLQCGCRNPSKVLIILGGHLHQIVLGGLQRIHKLVITRTAGKGRSSLSPRARLEFPQHLFCGEGSEFQLPAAGRPRGSGVWGGQFPGREVEETCDLAQCWPLQLSWVWVAGVRPFSAVATAPGASELRRGTKAKQNPQGMSGWLSH